MKESNEPTRAPATEPGTWGLVGRVAHEMPVHYCVNGETLVRIHPELAGDSRYQRPGVLWEVTNHSEREARYRIMRLQLTNWNPDNPRTCPGCREVRKVLIEEQQGKPIPPHVPALS